jgi:two-component system sensor histidine kinase KdpD
MKPGILLVCVMADGQALELIRHACVLKSATSRPWRVLHLDTLAARYASRAVLADLEQALKLAQDEGAETVLASLSFNGAAHLVRQIVQQAQAGSLSDVLIGSRATGNLYWPGFGERLSDFAEVLGESLPGTQIHMLVSSQPRGRRPSMPTDGHSERLTAAYWRVPLLVLALCTALCAAIASLLHPINLILIYLVGVLYVALHRDLLASVVTMVGAILIFDWIFVAPRWSFKPTDPQYFFTFAIAVCVGLAVSRLALQAREAAVRATALADRAQSLSLMAQNLTRAHTPQDIARTLQQSVERGVGARAALILGDTAPPASLAQAGAAHRFELGTAGGTLGVLTVRDLPPARQTAEDLHLLQALANQAALALEKAQADERSRQAAVEAEAERVRNTLLAGISHDFRTPLTTIIGVATTLQSQAHQITPAQQDALLQNLLDQAQRLQWLTSDLLDLARLQEGAIQPVCEWCPLGELVRDALALTESAVGHVQVDLRFDEDDTVWCDSRLLTQALSNLLLNAAQHSPENGTLTVSAQLGESGWMLSVRDQGPGITPGRETEVFRKFHREQASQTTSGTGLGLAICEAVTSLHGGSVTARNDSGAVFEMRFPWPAGVAHPQDLSE